MIPLFKVFMSPNVIQPVTDILSSGYISQGPKVDEFEGKLREFFGHDYVLTLNSATSGLTLAIRLLKKERPEINWPGIDQDDIVLSTPLTCTATNWPILANNLKIKWVDTDPNTCNIDLDDLRKKLSPKTKVIMVVHWGGYPVDLDKLSDIQDECQQLYGFRPYVVEDCAHAFGATFRSAKIGTSHGNLCVFSLQAIKHLTTGDGGLLLVPDEFLYEKGKLLRWYGIDRDKRNYKGKDFRLEHDVEEWGYKFHMNDINATIGLANLTHMENNLNICRSNGHYYDQHLKNLRNIELLENADNRESAYWLYTMKILNDKKLDFMEFMKDKNIMVSQVHQRNDLNTCVEEFKDDNLSNLDMIEKQIICIPVGWWISHVDRTYIVECIKEFDIIN